MATYKCGAVGDCEKANKGEIFERSPGDDLRCPECTQMLVRQTQATVKGPDKKLIVAAAAAAVVVIAGVGGGLYYKKSHASVESAGATAPASAEAVTVPASASSVADAAPATASGPAAQTGIAPSDADISAQRKDSDAKLKQGDASGAERASNQAAAKEMVKAAIAQMSQGKLDEAEKALNDAAARDPKQSLVYYNMGVLRLKQGRVDDALKQFEASFLNGFAYFDDMQKDPDLDAIRNDPRFQALVKKYRTVT